MLYWIALIIGLFTLANIIVTCAWLCTGHYMICARICIMYKHVCAYIARVCETKAQRMHRLHVAHMYNVISHESCRYRKPSMYSMQYGTFNTHACNNHDVYVHTRA